MLNNNELNKYLSIDSVNSNILNNCSNELSLSVELMKFTESYMIPYINNIDSNTAQDETVQHVIILLFIQGIKSFKSSILLASNGYYTTSIIVVRNIIETIINISYIFENPEESYDRAVKYLNSNSKWTDETIKTRAYLSFNSTLYNLYRLTSDYTHSNYTATSQNYNKNGDLILHPSDEKTDQALDLINSVYYYLIEFISELYKIDFSYVKKLKKTTGFKERYKSYKMFNFSKRYDDD